MREVPVEQAQQFADYHNLLFMETSSKTGYNVEKTFISLASKIYDLLEEGRFRIQEGWDGIKSGYQSNALLNNPSSPPPASSRPPITLAAAAGRHNNASDDDDLNSKKNCC